LRRICRPKSPARRNAHRRDGRRAFQYVDGEHDQRRPFAQDPQNVCRAGGSGAMLPDIDALEQSAGQIAGGQGPQQIADQPTDCARDPDRHEIHVEIVHFQVVNMRSCVTGPATIWNSNVASNMPGLTMVMTGPRRSHINLLNQLRN
jgi:hypothetical protein